MFKEVPELLHVRKLAVKQISKGRTLLEVPPRKTRVVFRLIKFFSGPGLEATRIDNGTDFLLCLHLVKEFLREFN